MQKKEINLLVRLDVFDKKSDAVKTYAIVNEKITLYSSDGALKLVDDEAKK